jgi:ATP-dependent protease ClpP protease subunit
MRVSFEHSVKLNEKLMRKMAERSNGKISQEELAEMCKLDIWMEPEEALEYGFIDEIIKER